MAKPYTARTHHVKRDEGFDQWFHTGLKRSNLRCEVKSLREKHTAPEAESSDPKKAGCVPVSGQRGRVVLLSSDYTSPWGVSGCFEVPNMLGVPLRPASRRLPSITEDPTPPSTPRRSTFGADDGEMPQEDLGSLPPPPRTPRKRHEEQAEEIPMEQRSSSSLTSFFQSLRVSRRLSLKPVRPGSPMPTPSPPNEFRKSGTFGVRDEDRSPTPSPEAPQIVPCSLPAEVTPPRPPRRRQTPEQHSTPPSAGPSSQPIPTLPKWPHTPPASDANRESLEERDNLAGPNQSPLGPHLPEADLPILIASHLLSTQATAMLSQSSSLREQADAMHRLAEQSLEWGRTALAMADREREVDRPQRASSINWGDLARDERRRRAVSLPTDNSLTLSLLEEAEGLGAEGFAKLRAAEASWQRALATLREEAGPRPASMLSTNTEKRRRNKLRKQKSERTWWGRRKAS